MIELITFCKLIVFFKDGNDNEYLNNLKVHNNEFEISNEDSNKIIQNPKHCNGNQYIECKGDQNYNHDENKNKLLTNMMSTNEVLKKSIDFTVKTFNRPTNLSLNLDIKPDVNQLNINRQKYQTNLFIDNFNEECASRKLFMPSTSLASPLTSLKQMMNSPLWNFKVRIVLPYFVLLIL